MENNLIFDPEDVVRNSRIMMGMKQNEKEALFLLMLTQIVGELKKLNGDKK